MTAQQEEKRLTKLSRREMLKLIGAGMTGALLASCGPTAPAEPNAPAKEEAPAASDAEAAAPQAPAEEEVTIAYWFLGGKRWEDFYTQNIFPEFNKEHPNIKLVPTVLGGWTDLYNKLVTSAAGGAPPELVRQKDFFTPDFAVRGILLQLDDYLATSTEVKADAFLENPWKNASWNGKQVAMPLHIFIHYPHMNVSLFEKAGLLNSDGLPQAPDNWDEFKETAAKLTDPSNGVWGTMLRDYGGQEDTVNFFHVFLTMAGGKFVDDNYEKFLFNSPEGLDALNFQVNLIKEGMMMSPGAPSENIIENNKIGIWWHAANYWPGLLENNPDLQWSTSINPMRKTRGAVIRANHLVIFKEAAHTEAAWKFMEFHMRPDTDYLYAQNANYITAVKENHSKPYYEGNYEGRKGVTFATEFEQLAIAENQPQPTFPGYQESTFKIGAQLMEAYLQQKSPEEALTQAELEGNEVLASARRMLGIGASQ